MGGAPGEALGVCVVRGWRGKLKSRQLPTDLDVYLSGASAVSAATVGFCSLQAAVPKERQMTDFANQGFTLDNILAIAAILFRS